MSAIAGKLGAVYNNYSGTDKSKLLADFQDDETWTSGAGTQADDATNYRLGTESIRITSTGDTALYSDQNSITLNIDQFQSGAASDSDDYIYAIFYVSDYTKVANVTIGFDADATYDGTNAYTYAITSVVTGWNYVKIEKSAFSSSGSPDWSSVNSMRVSWTGQSTSTGAYVSFQAVYLVDDAYELVLSQNTAYTMETIALFYNWSLDIDAGLVDANDFDGNGWGKSAQTIKKFTTTNEKYWADKDYLTNLGTDVVLLLYVNTTNGNRYEGTAKLETESYNVTVDELVTDSLNYRGEGEVYSTNLQIIAS